ncbi:MAG: amidase family protein, partial [Anaerolineae bacterium]
FQMNRTILSAEAAAVHQERMDKQSEDFGADVRTRLLRGAGVSAAEYVRARRRQVELTRALELYFTDVDIILTPATRTPAERWGEDAVSMAGSLTGFTGPFNLTGFPAIALPCGFTQDRLPIGLQLVANRWNEALVLRVAHQYQLVTDWHAQRPPLA